VSIGRLACGTELAHRSVVAELFGGPELELVRLLDEVLIQDMLDDHWLDFGVNKRGSLWLFVIGGLLLSKGAWHT
jgi:hypothetical protein